MPTPDDTWPEMGFIAEERLHYPSMRGEKDHLLFQQFLLSERLRKEAQAMAEYIATIGAEHLLPTASPELLAHLEYKYIVPPITLFEDELGRDDPKDVWIPGGTDSYSLPLPQEKRLISATSITIYLPFQGERWLFSATPTQGYGTPPHASIREASDTTSRDHLAFTFIYTAPDQATLEHDWEEELDKLRRWVGEVNRMVEPHNAGIPAQIQSLIESRRKKLQADRAMVESLKIPLRRRENTPMAIPLARKPISITPQATNAPGSQPEWELTLEEYDHILRVLDYMGAVMEQYPEAFLHMEEEHLRAHFLVQLNGQYEGLATGETFNLKGKADIYLPFKGRTAFIAECKFWQGQQGLLDALDQLLGYTIWHNTKVALLIFNRRKGFTDVLRKLREGLPQHPHFKEALPYAHHRGVRVLLRHGNDQERELIITALAFDIPGEDPPANTESSSSPA